MNSPTPNSHRREFQFCLAVSIVYLTTALVHFEPYLFAISAIYGLRAWAERTA